MVEDKVPKQLIYYPLAVVLLLILVEHLNIDQLLNKQMQMNLFPSGNFVKSQKATYTKKPPIGKILGDKRAIDLVWKLPQVQYKVREIEQLSKGSINLASLVDSYPTPKEPYYIIRVYENHPDKSTNAIYWFRVLNPSGAVEALDLIDNEYIPLEKWHPDGR